MSLDAAEIPRSANFYVRMLILSKLVLPRNSVPLIDRRHCNGWFSCGWMADCTPRLLRGCVHLFTDATE